MRRWEGEKMGCLKVGAAFACIPLLSKRGSHGKSAGFVIADSPPGQDGINRFLNCELIYIQALAGGDKPPVKAPADEALSKK
jgi:hypothetical protein